MAHVMLSPDCSILDASAHAKQHWTWDVKVLKHIKYDAGWKSVLEALAIAACDKTDTIVDQALDAVQPVIEGLFRPNAAIPADLFPLCLAVLSQAMRNSYHEKLSISAVYLAQTAGHCLAASNPTVRPHTLRCKSTTEVLA